MSPDSDRESSRFLSVRRREETDGCGCLRCRGLDYAVVSRSFGAAFIWGGRLLRRRPSVLLVFVLVGVAQQLSLLVPVEPGIGAAFVGIAGVFFGRGYAGLVGAGDLHGSDTRLPPVVTAATRLPAALGAFGSAAVGAAAVAVGLVVAGSRAGPALATTLGAGGGRVFDGLVLAAAVGVVVYVLVKCCFVPEACFIGGYGPLESVRVSWALTTIHRRKAVALTAGLVALFAVSVALEAGVDAGRPVVISVTFAETTVPVRSIGLSTATVPRLAADAGLSAMYYLVFAHQYVQGLVDEAAAV